jgi:hypothetical protein
MAACVLSKMVVSLVTVAFLAGEGEGYGFSSSSSLETQMI